MTAPWDFDYRPVCRGLMDDGGPRRDVVIATEHDVDAARVIELLAPLDASLEAVSLVSSHPIYWTRLRSSSPLDRSDVRWRLEQGGVRVRYVACARDGSQALFPPLDFVHSRPRRPREWKTREARRVTQERSETSWFLGSTGIDADRRWCGSGAGTRLAVIDDDCAEIQKLALDAEVGVGVSAPAQASPHAALMIGWAVGTSCFSGVAPAASPRLYVIPKPGRDMVSLPVAIIRAVDDGADVVVCATYIDDIAGPLLDDALELAACVGRAGRGSVVVFPTSREVSSPSGSVHASLSLSLGAPASHPLAFCIGPSGVNGGWFLWRERSGKARPFANRGPAIRWLAPGDDMVDPLAPPDRERVAHAESSGASAIAAGVALLVCSVNPELTRSELDRLLTITSVSAPGIGADVPLADSWDALPRSPDGDGHDAKHGYGRLSARWACLSASDPIALTLIRMGDQGAAELFAILQREDAQICDLYSPALRRWAVSVLLNDASVAHALAVLIRHVRLVSRVPARAEDHPSGALLRQIALVLRMAKRSARVPAPPESVATELVELERTLCEHGAHANASDWEDAFYARLARLWPPRNSDAGAEAAAE